MLSRSIDERFELEEGNLLALVFDEGYKDGGYYPK
jgi:hypothetical protein